MCLPYYKLKDLTGLKLEELSIMLSDMRDGFC